MIRLAVAAALLALPAAAQDRPALMQAHRGGAMRLLAHAAGGSIDPQVNYTAQYWQVFCFLYDGLVAFRKVPGPAGLEIVPDLAEAVPEPEAGGLVYRFRLRRGIRFSDGTPLRPADVTASFRRIFKAGSPTADSFYGAIDGAAECLAAPGTCTLPGVSWEGETITVTLTRPDPEFLTKLALPHASIVPEGTPAADTGSVPVPGTGPYAIASYDANEGLHIVRNRFFREWSAAAQPDGFPDRIDYEFGLEDEAEVTAIQNNQADWMFDGPPADRLAELGRRFAAQVHISPTFAIWFVPLNLHIPPFDDVRVRRAFAMAVDRRAAVKLFGGSALAVPACQILPPGLLGSQPACPLPYDPAQARRLVQESGTAGQTVTLVTDDSPAARAIGTYLIDVLADLGFAARLRTLSGNVQFTYIQNSGNRVQASLTSWYADYPSASNFLGGIFGCAAFRPNSDASPNIAGFCDPKLDTALRTALAAGDGERIARVDRAMSAQVPAVILFNPRYFDLVSARIGGFAYHEAFRWLIHLSWVR